MRARLRAATVAAGLLAGTAAFAQTPAPAPLEGILFYGQSNAGAGGTARAVLTSPLFPQNVVSFATARQTYSTQVAPPERFAGLQPLADVPQYAPFPATAMGFALADMAGNSGRRFFLHTVWYGGQPLATFRPGTPSWISLMNVATRLPQVAGEHAAVRALVFVQGEAGPYGRQVYGPQLRTLLGEARSALKAATGQEKPPFVLLTQINQGATAKSAATGVEMAQWDVAREDKAHVSLAGPMYHLPLADNIHQSNEGRMMLGEILALAYESSLRTGEMFRPVEPIEARRDGRVITIRFARPEGSGPLAWDEDWVAPAPDFGFAYEDEARSAQIERVEIAGAGDVRIVLDREPDAPGRVHYAQGQPPVAGWAASRGQLMAKSGVTSTFARRGFKVPEEIRHYAIRFTLTVN